MATAHVQETRRPPAASRLAARSGLAAALAEPAAPLIAALVVLVLYAAFSDGSAGLAAQARVQVAVAVIAALATGAVLWTGTLRFDAARRAKVGLALFAGFAVWSAISLAWSVAPDQTWSEFNRALTYVIVLAAAIVAGASNPRAPELLARGFLLAVVAVALYGIGQKLVPGLHISGLFDLNQPQSLPRLEAPLGYWNALALFLGMGVPVALAFAVDRARTQRMRLWSLLALELLLLTLGLTYSRGGVLALAVGLVAGVVLTRARLRSLLWFGIAALAALPPLLVALVDPDLTGVGVGLPSRESGGLALALLLLGSMFALRRAGRHVLALERTVSVDDARARTIGRRLAGGAGVLVVIVVLGVTFSSRGLTGTISHAWDSFTATPHQASVYSPDRLLSVDSENRWVWWKEAAGAASDRPLTGWGAGSFSVVQPLYGGASLPVKQPHSVVLQFLAETGIVGALLGLGGFGLLLAAALTRVRRLPPAERLVPAALIAVTAIYAFHTFYDWDWDIPGVTLPALVCLGVLAGRPRLDEAADGAVDGFGFGLRGAAIGLCALLMCAVALSGVVPSVAAGKASSALVEASGGSPAARAGAMADAIVASKLDPLSDAGLLVEAQIALGEGALGEARSDLFAAIRRDPDDAIAWQRLVGVEFKLHDYAATLATSRRYLQLFPTSEYGRALVFESIALLTPASGSATAQPTPAG